MRGKTKLPRLKTAEPEESLDIIGENLNFAAAESYKLLRTNLMFSFPDEHACKVIGVTSSMRGEGKSLTAVNVAYTIAESGQRVLLIDADLRIPSVARKMKMPGTPGLSNLLASVDQVNTAIQRYTFEKTGVRVEIMPAGDIPPNPSELLGSARMKNLLEVLKTHYDYIIIDLPPVVAVTDALVVSRLVHGMVLVCRQNYCEKSALAEAMRQLKFVEAKVLGVVFNCANENGSSYKRYSRHYREKYGYGDYYKESARA